ncbi:unnamed protein product [Blepharisma stoltei]|uniref:Uncharacterized protein n=1 Tax=Blepharisma stoltei TaxID=1481888 RepID=A0AAU9JZM0_9CILI|nr:unnamed protein product [Blepharisma stoltei]
MGNCCAPAKSKPALLPPETKQTIPDEPDNEPKINFKACISKIKVNGLGVKKAAIKIRFDKLDFNLEERTASEDVIKWSEENKFDYSTSLARMDHSLMKIWIIAEKKVIASSELKISSIINGPIHTSLSLEDRGKPKGRISFNVEMLEETLLMIAAKHINCQLEDDATGRYSASIKFMSNFTKESPHSDISDKPKWNFYDENPEASPTLQFGATIKTVRDASIQIRIYKHHKSGPALVAECWVGFTKLFREEMENIYRTESYYGSSEGTLSTLDFNKIKNAYNKTHLKTFKEELWLSGRRAGEVSGSLKIACLPVFQQLISGVNTEKGYQVQSSHFTPQMGKASGKLPKEIERIIELTAKIKESVNMKSKRGNPVLNDKNVFREKKLNFDELCKILTSSKRESMVCFTYTGEKNILKAQNYLIDLGMHLAEYAELVMYDIKPYYFKSLMCLIRRGELDIGYLSLQDNDPTLLPQKIDVAVRYLTLFHKMLKLAFSRMVFKGIDQMTQEYVECMLVLGWFRVPQFRAVMVETLKKKSYHHIDEWRGTEIDLDSDSETSSELVSVIDWPSLFYKLLPSEIKIEPMIAYLNDQVWINKIEKRGVAFLRFLEGWAEHVNKQFVVQHILWSSIPGYPVLLKCFLLEMKEREITEYPEALISAACKLLYNPKLISVMVRIIFGKTNVFDYQAVQESYNVLGKLFTAVYSYGWFLPPTFDSSFFLKGLKITIEHEIGLSVAKAISFLYYHYHMIRGHMREELLLHYILEDQFMRLFCHWCVDVRRMICYFFVFRVLSLESFSFEPEDDVKLNKKIARKLKKNLRNIRELANEEEATYIDKALVEYEAVYKEYEEWKNLLPEKFGNDQLFGVSDEFPYPIVVVKLNFVDLAERQIEDEW